MMTTLLLFIYFLPSTEGIDKRFDNPFLGNVIFWFVFCVIGQPMGVLMYAFDIWSLYYPSGLQIST